jgi:hypothetical protein
MYVCMCCCIPRWWAVLLWSCLLRVYPIVMGRSSCCVCLLWTRIKRLELRKWKHGSFQCCYVGKLLLKDVLHGKGSNQWHFLTGYFSFMTLFIIFKGLSVWQWTHLLQWFCLVSEHCLIHSWPIPVFWFLAQDLGVLYWTGVFCLLQDCKSSSVEMRCLYTPNTPLAYSSRRENWHFMI